MYSFIISLFHFQSQFNSKFTFPFLSRYSIQFHTYIHYSIALSQFPDEHFRIITDTRWIQHIAITLLINDVRWNPHIATTLLINDVQLTQQPTHSTTHVTIVIRYTQQSAHSTTHVIETIWYAQQSAHSTTHATYHSSTRNSLHIVLHT